MVTIESRGFHAWFRETFGKWQSPMHTDRHYLDKCNEYSPVGSLIPVPLPITKMSVT